MNDGDGTRHVSHGAKSTSAALSTSPLTEMCVTHPAQCAGIVAPAASKPAVTIDATCTTAMHGTATRFSTRPARVTR